MLPEKRRITNHGKYSRGITLSAEWIHAVEQDANQKLNAVIVTEEDNGTLIVKPYFEHSKNKNKQVDAQPVSVKRQLVSKIINDNPVNNNE
jgi:hypothetical protein